MSNQSQNAQTTERRGERRDGVVAGVVLADTEEALEKIDRIHRARAQGYDTLVALASGRSPELASVARCTDAQVIDLGHGVELEDDALHDVLAFVARQKGYSQIFFPDHNDTVGDPIDFAETISPPIERAQSVDELSEKIIAIPAYNEAEEIATVVEEASGYADCVLVIDDGSDDETAARAREAGAAVVRHEYNRGYGAALRTAFNEAARRGAVSLVTVDGDGQHDPSDIPVLQEVLETRDADVVIGSRFIDGADTDISPIRRFGVRTVNLLTNASLNYVRRRNRITDTQSGFRAYSGRAVRSLSKDRDLESQMGASTDILYHARKYGYDIEEVGISISYDVENPSSQHPIAHGAALVTNILKTTAYQRPFLSLATPGLVSVIFGLWLGARFVAASVGSELVWTALFVLAIAFSWAGLLASLVAVLIFVAKVHGS